MKLNRAITRAFIAAIVTITAVACASTMSTRATSTLKVYDPTKWFYWGGDAGQTRYAPLNEINLKTVSRLKIAWRWTAEATGGAQSNNFKATPLLDEGVLYVPWLNHGMAAIDAGTGKTIWTFEPQPVGNAGSGTLQPRSLAYWTNGKEKRLYNNSLDGRLIAVDARTGRPAPGFGKNGQINLGDDLRPERTQRGAVRSVSPALVVGDVVVVQIIPSPGRNKEVLPGDIRGYDVLTGKLVWTFHVIPKAGEYGYNTWGNGSAEFVGQDGVWTMMSADPELGMVYLPTEDASNDFAGVERPGDNLFSDGIVALDAKTGRRVWHFQTMHHGILDYDSPSAPVLHDIVQNGKRIKVVTLLTKEGFIFTFDRKTGHPIWPIEERAVPQSKVPGEHTSPTQPFPTKPAPFATQGYSEDNLINFTPDLRRQAVELLKSYDKGPLFTPPAEVGNGNGIKGTLVVPGFGGGANWNGAAFDPDTGVIYIPTRNRPSFVGVMKGNPATTNMAYVETNNTTANLPNGLPLLKPPYSELVAVDMNKGEHLWHVPDGGAPDNVRNSPLLQGLGLDFDHMGQFDVRPGPLLTKEILFMGESGTISASHGGPAFRAYDKRTGAVVSSLNLPTLSTGAPMTYKQKGRQYIVIAVSAPGKPAELVALTLDGISDNGAPPPGGVPLGVAPPSIAAAAATITATPQELATGQAAFARVCASCHAADGKGGTGPAITGRNDFANIVRVISSGQGEMPPQSTKLTAAEIDAVGKFVVKTLGPPPAPAGRGGAGAGAAGGAAGRGGGAGRGGAAPPADD